MASSRTFARAITIVLLCITAFHYQLSAQQGCETVYPATPSEPRELSTNHFRSDPYVIPVLFHVYWYELLAPVPPTHIQSILAETNEKLRGQNASLEMVPEAFQSIIGDTKIELQFAKRLPNNECTSGIIYHYFNFSQGMLQPADFSIETSHYLNVHVFPNTNSYAFLPNDWNNPNDPGDYVAFTSWDVNNNTNALAHEVGHWFGLYHPFGAVNEAGGDCGDDFVEDTPITRGSYDCDPELTDCTPGVVENVHNFMDYTNCGAMFTVGQAQRINSFLEDSTFNRYIIHQPTNLDYTAVGDTSICESTFQVWHTEYPDCDSTLVKYSYLVNGGIPDSVVWEVQTPDPTISTASMPYIYYTSSGMVNLDLHLYFGSEVETVPYSHLVQLTEVTTNLPLIPELPLILDPDQGTLLPNMHMNMIGAPPAENWQVCNFAGYESDQCVYVPAKIVDGTGTVDIEIGMFDMTGLVDPTISFHVAAAMVPQGAYHTLQILFRDECSSAFVGDVWLTRSLYDIFNGNTTTGFIPSSDDQWVEVTQSFPGWVLSGHGFITIRLITTMSPGNSGEPFYLDNFRVGNGLTTAISDNLRGRQGDLQLFPNPATERINWKCGDETTKHLRVFNVGGRIIVEKPVNGSAGSLDIEGWAPGFYQLMIETQSGVITEKFVVE